MTFTQWLTIFIIGFFNIPGNCYKVQFVRLNRHSTIQNDKFSSKGRFSGISNVVPCNHVPININLINNEEIFPENIKNISVTTAGFGFSQLKPFAKIAVPFFLEDVTARNSLLTVIALTFLNSGVSVAFSYIGRDFYTALSNR